MGLNVCRINFGDISEEKEKTVLKILKMKTIAVVGISPKEDRPSNYVPRYLQERGYKIIPVRPGVKEILGEKAYKKLSDVPENVEVVNVFRRSEFCVDIAKQAVEIKAKALWLQEGIINEEAKKIAEENGLLFIMDYCLKKAYAKYIEHRLQS